MLAWGPLLAGSLTGVGLTAVLLPFAGPAETSSDLAAGLRCSFVPVLAGAAFLLHDPERQLAGALPARTWHTALLRMALALPVICAGGVIQLLLAAHALALDLRAGGAPHASLPVAGLATEFAAWCLLALALSAGLDRTRWRDLAGVTGAFAALAVIGVAAVLPWHLVPGTITGMSADQRTQWAVAWVAWACAGTVAAVAVAWASGDPWRRLRPGSRRRRPGWCRPGPGWLSG